MESFDDEARSSLREYLGALRRRRWIIVAFVGVFLAVALAYGALTTPVYQGTANLLLTPQVSSALLQASNSSDAVVTVDVPTVTQVMESTSLRDYVRKTVPGAPPVTVTEVGTTNVVEVSVNSIHPKLAARAANAYANGYIHLQQAQTVSTINGAVQLLNGRLDSIESAIGTLQGELAHAAAASTSSLTSQLQGFQQEAVTLQNEITNDELSSGESSGDGQVVSTATVPTKPVKPKTVEYAVLAVLLGLVLGIGLAMLLEFFDDGIRTREEVERVADGHPVLALIPEMENWRDGHQHYLVSRVSPNSVAAEAYRSLRTSIQFLGLDRSIRTVQFTSSSAAEGKTTTVANLAVVMAQAGLRVVVVGCDLRRPRLHEFFNLSNRVGFTSVLLGETSLQDALQSVPGLPNLYVLASGQIPPNPSELLSGARAGDLFAALADNADIVLIDSPPVLPVTDAAVLAGRIDSVVMVASVGTSTRSQVSRAVETLGRVKAPISGIVLNRSRESSVDSTSQDWYGGPAVPSPGAGDHANTNGHAEAGYAFQSQ
jgi:succinoglycan biosynthesis transport protein ExoP